MTDQGQGATPPAAVAAPQASGIGGWLILPMLGLFATIGQQLINLPDMMQAFAALPTLNDATKSNLISADLVALIILSIIAPAILLVLMFGKSRRFPRWYIVWTIAAAVFGLIDLMIGYGFSHEAMEAEGVGFFNYDSMRVILGALIGVCVWVPYMLNSVRVKNTFVN